MESFKQKRANLLNDNPIASHGSWISKHSIAAGSPLHQGGSYKQSPLDQIQGNNSTTRRGTFSGDGGQLFDADGDGDSMFNDSNNDGTMASRTLDSFNGFNKEVLNGAVNVAKSQVKGISNLFGFDNKASGATHESVHTPILQTAGENELRAGEKKEGRPTVETSRSGDVKEGFTTTMKTTQPVVRTEEGDRAYAAKSQKEKDIQDATFKRNMTSTRKIKSSGLQSLTTKGPSADIDFVHLAKLQRNLDPLEKVKYTKETGGSQYGNNTSHASTGYINDDKTANNVLGSGTYVKLEGIRKSGKKFDILEKGKSTGMASTTTVKEDLAKGRKQVAADRSAKAKADILASRAEKKKIKDKKKG